METSKKRIRRVFSPLTLTCSIEPLATGAQVAQVYFAGSKEYVPDREGVLGLATVLVPTVCTPEKTDDWTDGLANARLGSVVWLVGGRPIADVWGEGTYSIDMSATARRGTLTIKKNLQADTQVVLTFEAQLTDPRTSVTYTVRSNDIVLSATTAAESERSITVSRDLVEYDAFLDFLLERQWCIDNGVAPDMSEQEALSQGTPYVQQVSYACYSGSQKIAATGVSLQQLVGNTYVDASENIALVHDRAAQTITFDCRLLPENTRFRLVYAPDDSPTRYAHFSVARRFSSYDFDYVNAGDFAADSKERLLKAVVTTKGTTSRKLPHPEAQMVIQWLTDGPKKQHVAHNQGEMGRIDLTRVGMGNTRAEAWFDVYVDITYRHWAVITTEKGELIVDDTYRYIIT